MLLCQMRLPPTPELVEQEVTLRKIALVGASNAAQMQDIIQRGLIDGMRLIRADRTRSLSKDEQARITNLDQIGTAIDGIETAGAAIKADIATNKITEIKQVKNDSRWPS